MIFSASGHVVVRQENQLQAVGRLGIVVDALADVVRQLDDQLRQPVARRRLAGDDHDARRPIAVGIGLHRVPARDDAEDVQELALVFVDALGVDIDHRRRVDA